MNEYQWKSYEFNCVIGDLSYEISMNFIGATQWKLNISQAFNGFSSESPVV